jgi:hypothetical protein
MKPSEKNNHPAMAASIKRICASGYRTHGT